MIRVGLTGAGDSLEEAAEECRRLGMQPVLLPCIAVTAAATDVIDEFRNVARAADWIVLTSARAVTIVWPDASLPMVPVAAVGKATARAAAAAGGRIEITGDQGGKDLMNRLGPRIDRALVAYPHAALTAFDLVGSMTKAGARVKHEAVYAIDPIPPAGDPVDAVVFGSPSAVKGWCAARTLDGLVVAVTGLTTAASVEAAGYPTLTIPTSPGYLEALEAVATLEIVANQKEPL